MIESIPGGQPYATGEKIYIGPVEVPHIENRVKWINDPQVQATLNFDVPVSVVGTEQWLRRAAADAGRRDFSIFSMAGEYIGFGGFLGIDWRLRAGELYVTIGNTSYWGGGYGTDAYRTITRFGFEELGLNRIWGYQLLHNEGAHRIVEKLGWTREGCLRQAKWSHGKTVDAYVVSILRHDWL